MAEKSSTNIWTVETRKDMVSLYWRRRRRRRSHEREKSKWEVEDKLLWDMYGGRNKLLLYILKWEISEKFRWKYNACFPQKSSWRTPLALVSLWLSRTRPLNRQWGLHAFFLNYVPSSVFFWPCHWMSWVTLTLNYLTQSVMLVLLIVIRTLSIKQNSMLINSWV